MGINVKYKIHIYLPGVGPGFLSMSPACSSSKEKYTNRYTRPRVVSPSLRLFNPPVQSLFLVVSWSLHLLEEGRVHVTLDLCDKVSC